MKATNYISGKEHKILLATTILWIAVVGLCFCSELIVNHNESVAAHQRELAILAGAKPGPTFSGPTIYKPTLPIHLISIFIFTTLLLKKTTVSFLTTACYFVFFIKALIERFDYAANEEFAANTNILSKIELATNDLDILAFIFLPILLFWQFSILLRILIKNTHRKNILP